MDNIITVKFQPNSGGQEFDVRNVTHYSGVSVDRPTGPGGRLGSFAHNIGPISITRRKSLEERGEAQMEAEIVKLASYTDKKAYFGGSITIARPDNPTSILQTVRWNEGHIVGLQTVAAGSEILETIQIAVTELIVDDVTFRRVATQ